MFRDELYSFWSQVNKQEKIKNLTNTRDKKKTKPQKTEPLVLNSIPLTTLKKIIEN